MHTASEPKLKPIKIVKCSKIAKYFISSHFTKRHCALKLITRIRFTYREHSGVQLKILHIRTTSIHSYATDPGPLIQRGPDGIYPHAYLEYERLLAYIYKSQNASIAAAPAVLCVCVSVRAARIYLCNLRTYRTNTQKYIHIETVSQLKLNGKNPERKRQRGMGNEERDSSVNWMWFRGAKYFVKGY